MIKRALVFQHMDDEPPGLFGEFLSARGAAVDIVMLHRGEEIPSLAPYDFLLVMGGAMDIWETEANPWLVDEKRAIREWAINRNRPFLGICLGLQLLAEALGGKVGLSATAEVGVCDVKLSALGRRHGITRNLKPVMPVMQWHHAEIQKLPAGAEVLATSPTTRVQIMSVADVAVGTQFHAELNADLVERWAHIPQYIEWLEAALGARAYARVRARALPLMPHMAEMSRTLLTNLLDGKALSKAA
jgi:GMP synthase-like glutamine amidotransferase